MGDGPAAASHVLLVAVSFHGEDDARGLVQSLLASEDPHWELVVVDNAGDRTEALADLAAAAGPRVRVLRAPGNLGYLGAARFALAGTFAAPDRPADDRPDWVVVCNTDVRFASDSVGRLRAAPADHVVAPAIVSSRTGRDQNPFLRRRPTAATVRRWRWQFRWVWPARLLVAADNLRQALRGPTPSPGADAADIYAPHGSCLVLPRAYFAAGGTLDHGPFLFGEEVTVAERCRHLGIGVRYDPEIRVEHAEHASTGTWRSATMLDWQRDAVDHIAATLTGAVPPVPDGVRSLVIVAPYVPYAGIRHAGGEYLRRFVLAAVAAGWTVRLVAPDTPENSEVPDTPGLEVERFPASSGPAARLVRLARTGIQARSGRAWWRRLTPRARGWLRGATLVDLQWSEALWNAEVLRALLPNISIVGLAHDVRTQSLTRAAREARPLPRALARLGLPRARTRELRSIGMCDLVRVFKDDDRRWLQERVPTPIEVVPVPPPERALPGPRPSGRVLFLGAFRRSENVEAAEWLLDEVLPLVRRNHPDVRVRIAGADPPPRLTRRADASVEVTGFLESLEEAYHDVSCVVVPLHRGAGVKFKTVEALRAGFPVISTSVGAEGVREACGRAPRAVTDDAVDFAREVVAVLDDEPAAILAAGGPETPGPAGFDQHTAAGLARWSELRRA